MNDPFDKVFFEPMLTPGEKLVMFAHLAEPGAGVARLSMISGMEEKYVARAVKELKKRGLIEEAK